MTICMYVITSAPYVQEMKAQDETEIETVNKH